MSYARFVKKLSYEQKRRMHIAGSYLDLSENEKLQSSYFKEVADSFDFSIHDLVKLPFRTVRSTYFKITRTYVYLPEERYQAAMKNMREYLERRMKEIEKT